MDNLGHFIGREKEIALFTECLAAILPENVEKYEGRKLPQILSFYGDAGVGKTALKERFIEIIKEKQHDIYLLDIEGHEFYTVEDNLVDLIKAKTNSELHFSFEFDPWADYEEYNDSLCEYRNLFDNKPVLIFLDECQEMNMETYSLQMKSFILPFCRKYQNVLFVFLGRYSQAILYQFIYSSWAEKVYGNIFHEQRLDSLTFEESKRFLNGFFAQFSDTYLKKIYDYTKGKPAILQFLVDLVKSKKASVESILNELLQNEGQILTELQFVKSENEDLEHKVIATMTHNLNQKFGNLLTNFELIKILIDQKEKNEPTKYAIQEEVARFYNHLLDATETFNTTYQILEKQHLHLEKTHLFSFFREEISPMSAFISAYTFESENIWIEIDRNALKDAFRNLIHNAEKHGFTEKDKQYRIVFEVSETDNFVKISYKNNGKPFPKGFSFDEFKQLSGKAGKRKGAGIGGFWINKVIDLHKGKFIKVEVADNEVFPIQFNILLPINQIHNK